MSEIRAKKSGLAAEAQQKVHGKFDSQFAQQIFGWISYVTGETLPTTGDINEFISTLKDGVLLCKLVNALSRNSDEKVNNSVLPFRYAANIAYFLSFVGNYVGKNELFKTVDLYEGQDPNSVLVCLAALARKSEKVFGKPGLGPKEAGGGTSRQPKAAEPIIGLQAGSSKGATQSGMENKIKRSRGKYNSKSEKKKRKHARDEIKKLINEGRSNAEIKKLINKEKKRRQEVKNKKRN
uniref:Calponin-homology (CH) domain-containing protein n=1 Tax=Meloidogyne enterolobii TaxID=390850 RepID=A0A6V7X0L8_MELEN|nr:unnamed protein product [Meloidogyne enterolobii]